MDPEIPEPANGAGVVETDPDQSQVSQSSETNVTGDIDQIPEAEPACPGPVNDVMTSMFVREESPADVQDHDGTYEIEDGDL